MNQTDNIITNIKPSTAIRHDYNAFSKLCHKTQAIIVVFPPFIKPRSDKYI